MSDRTNGSDAPEDIESRIRATQEDLKHDLDALEDRVSPENLKRQATERVDETTDAVREKAVEATRQVGDTVRSRIDETSERFRNDERMSALSMLGLAAVIGIGLLLTRRERQSGGRHDRDRGHDRGGFERGGRDPRFDAGRDYGGPSERYGAYRSPRT